MDSAQLFRHTSRHGFYRTTLAYSSTALRRLVDVEFMRVYVAEESPTTGPEAADYVTRCVTDTEYGAGAKAFQGEHQRKWAFDRGDRCFANFDGDQMVGYTFYGLHSTVVSDDLEFRFPEKLIYAYASFTQPAHRGRRLALARANMRKFVDQEAGNERRVVWYVVADDYAARAAGRLFGGVLVGYLGYAKFRGRTLFFASPGCKRAGVSLALSFSPPNAN